MILRKQLDRFEDFLGQVAKDAGVSEVFKRVDACGEVTYTAVGVGGHYHNGGASDKGITVTFPDRVYKSVVVLQELEEVPHLLRELRVRHHGGRWSTDYGEACYRASNKQDAIKVLKLLNVAREDLTQLRKVSVKQLTHWADNSDEDKPGVASFQFEHFDGRISKAFACSCCNDQIRRAVFVAEPPRHSRGRELEYQVVLPAWDEIVRALSVVYDAQFQVPVIPGHVDLLRPPRSL